MKGFSDYAFFEKFKFQVSRILNGEKIRMISSGFLHVDWLHLGFNMYALYLFGDIVDARLGSLVLKYKRFVSKQLMQLYQS